MSCNFQDPEFNNVERTLLQSRGYIVLDDPQAFEHITPTTFVFAPYVPYNLVAKVFEKVQPALCIVLELDRVVERSFRGDILGCEANEALALAIARYRDMVDWVTMPVMDSLDWSSTEIRWLRVDRERNVRLDDSRGPGMVTQQMESCILKFF